VSLLDRIRREPRRFRFDALVRVLLRRARQGDPAEIARFRTPPSLAYPPAEINGLEDGATPRVSVGMMGLIGPMGVLPRLYTEVAATALRQRSRALHDFLDMLCHRMIAAFARAGIKYRLARSAETARLTEPPQPDAAAQALLSFTGYGTPGLTPRLEAGEMALLHYAGLLAMRPRSADRLAALVSDWLGRPTQVEQFAGAWLLLPPDQRTALGRGVLPGTFNRLGVDAAAGVRAFDIQARIVLRVGPLDRGAFEALLPDRPGLRRLVSLVRAYLGFEVGFAVNPVLAAAEVPRLRLDTAADPAPRLGWNTWLPVPPEPGRQRDAPDAVFEAETVEAEEVRR
jgi:type VI secretion system protein ImpH